VKPTSYVRVYEKWEQEGSLILKFFRKTGTGGSVISKSSRKLELSLPSSQ
jgi:hypothetical protein